MWRRETVKLGMQTGSGVTGSRTGFSEILSGLAGSIFLSFKTGSRNDFQ